ncbi:MAG TPA: TonB-dependent receptor [Arenibaculum sp.]|nr:TonB-dependent receptor [Arenibaculum sp.]
MKRVLTSTCCITGLLAAASLSAHAPARAQEGPDAGSSVRLDRIVVTAARAERPLSAIPGSVTVIDRPAIERQLAISSNPAEALSKLVPGYSPANQTISGASETFRGRSVLVLVDGVPRNTPLRDVSRIVGLIDLNTVERIEVVNGASSLYGSGATGGTINFITRDATPGAPRVSTYAALRAFTADVGESRAPEASVSVTGDAGIFDYAGIVTGKLARKAFDGGGRELPSDPLIGQGGADRFEDYNAALTLGRTFGEQRFEVGGQWTYFDQEPDYLTDYTTDPVSPDFAAPYPADSILEDSKYLTARYTHSGLGIGALSLTAFHNDIEKRFGFGALSAVNPFVYYSGDPLDPVSLEGQTTLTAERTGVGASVDTPLDMVAPGVRLTWGGDYTHDETRQFFQDGVDAIAPMTQDGYAVFGQLEVPVGDLLLLRGGARHERFDLEVASFTRPAYATLGFGVIPAVDVIGGSFDYSQTTYNLGAVAFLTDELELFGGFSQGFELPDVGSFTRRAGLGAAGPVDYSAIGPRAQVVDTYEIGLRGDWERVRGSISGYVSTSDDGVTFDAATNTLSQQKEEIYGVELTGEIDATPALALGTVLTYREGKYDSDQDGEIDAWLPNNRIANSFKGTLYATYLFDFGLTVRPEIEYLGGRSRFDGNRMVEIDPATLVNLAADYPLLGGELTFGVRNLLDTDYENPTATATRGAPVAGFGRLVTVGYRRTF